MVGPGEPIIPQEGRGLPLDPTPPLAAPQTESGDALARGGLWISTRRSLLFRHLVLDPGSALGTFLVLAAVFVAVAGPLFAPYSPIIPDYNSMSGAPSGPHPFGTDIVGDDVLSRVLYGARLSIGTAAELLTLAGIIGLTLGALAGYFGRWIDEAIMRLTDLFLAFPALILALAVASTLGAGLQSAMIALSMAFWPTYARLLRAQVLSLKGRSFVEAARVGGGTNFTIMRRHILPNSMSPIIIQLSMDMGFAILATSSLSFIGVGAQPPSPEWGAMIVAGQDYLRTDWWLAAFPGIALTLTVLGFNLLGDGLRDAFDPRSKFGS
ncbi:MAG TPA: ABC transporter permease [Chloroflexota bacterium]|nr:ABC transporter permease [Chloroflexota bacterium]